jgi:prepilin-type N-terminal cleavage/methylation domain-containing protein
MKTKTGFSMIELLIVIAIIAFLSALTIPSLMKFLARSKRSEAMLTLRSLYLAEKAYHMEHGSYSPNLMGSGQNSVGWKPEGTLLYTYGFPGAEGTTCLVGELKTSSGALQGARVSDAGFVIAAAGDIDGDGIADVITIDQQGKITIVVDDLKDE